MKKRSEIVNDAKQIIQDIFKNVLESNDKNNWRLAIDVADGQVYKTRGTDRNFVWRYVKQEMLALYKNKFLK